MTDGTDITETTLKKYKTFWFVVKGVYKFNFWKVNPHQALIRRKYGQPNSDYFLEKQGSINQAKQGRVPFAAPFFGN